MFINCPFCKALVATDPATDQPPERCPRCAAKLRGVPLGAPAPAASTVAQGDKPVDAPPDPAFLVQAPVPEASLPAGEAVAAPSELSSRIHQIVALETPASASAIAPIATLLKRVDDAPASRSGAEAEAASSPSPAPTTGPGSPQPAVVVASDAEATNADASNVATGEAATAAIAAPAIAPSRTRHAATANPAVESARVAAEPAAATIAAASVPAAPAPTAPQAARPMPSFAHRRARLGASGFHWKTLAAIAALGLLLALQLLLADRAQLATDARWRPLLSNVCGVLGCALPPWREPTAFTVLARQVRPHPSTPGALRVTATFRNDARWPQPWPRVRLTLSDVNGNAVATRDFSAHDYLGAAPAQAELHSGQSASIAMDIVEPEPRSVAFDFDLH